MKNTKMALWVGLAIAISVCVLPAAAGAATTCDGIASLSLPETTITSAQIVAAGEFAMPAGVRANPRVIEAFKSLPAFCRITATLKPSTDSDIRVEVWMPASGWNGKFQAVGNGGWAGEISYDALAEAIREGYATTSTDTGHVGNRGTFALDHPEKLIDFGYRSEHDMTVQAKAIIKAFYGTAPKISYFNGCSTGGRQALKEAQKYPNDFDGIIAGAAANPRTLLSTWQLWVAQAVLAKPESFIPQTKYPMIHKAVLDQCDALDGLKDGLINDPTRCHFNPSVLLCKGEDSPSCLTAPQVEAVTKMLTPPTNPRTKAVIFPAWEPGTELGWAFLARGPEPLIYATDQYKYVVFKDQNWDWRTLNFDSDVALAEKMDKGIIDAGDPNLREFMAHGGKLFMYHGWSDPNVAPLASVNYYNSVLETMGGPAKTASWIRLFMEPGMGHCEGGEGPDTFDKMAVIEQWVEKGNAPERIVAAHKTNGAVDRTRPLCAYPQVSTYKGSGSTDDASSFVCAAEK